MFSSLSSFIVTLDSGLPYLILMIANLCSALLVLLTIPETKDKDLPDSVEEALYLFHDWIIMLYLYICVLVK